MAEFVYQMYQARKAVGDKVILDDDRPAGRRPLRQGVDPLARRLEVPGVPDVQGAARLDGQEGPVAGGEASF